MEYMYILKQALMYILVTFWCYQIAISLCALVKLKDKKLIIPKPHLAKSHNPKYQDISLQKISS